MIWVRDTSKRRWDRPEARGESLPPEVIDQIYAGEIMLRPGCGLEIPRLTLSKSGLEAELVKYERAPL